MNKKTASKFQEFVWERLDKIQDKERDYREFQQKLIPNINPERILGVRTPALKSLAAELYNLPGAWDYLHMLPHKYYEEDNLHMFILTKLKDYNNCLEETELFLPYINNWSTCDVSRPKVFKKNAKDFISVAISWVKSNRPYTIRYGIGSLMSICLDTPLFKPELLDVVASANCDVSVLEPSFRNIKGLSIAKTPFDQYYIQMMIAWYFATALAKQWESALPYIEKNRLDKWTHNKAIQKARESFRVSDEHKAILKGLKR